MFSPVSSSAKRYSTSLCRPARFCLYCGFLSSCSLLMSGRKMPCFRYSSKREGLCQPMDAGESAGGATCHMLNVWLVWVWVFGGHLNTWHRPVVAARETIAAVAPACTTAQPLLR